MVSNLFRIVISIELQRYGFLLKYARWVGVIAGGVVSPSANACVPRGTNRDEIAFQP
jgi:hypothetical protein